MALELATHAEDAEFGEADRPLIDRFRLPICSAHVKNKIAAKSVEQKECAKRRSNQQEQQDTGSKVQAADSEWPRVDTPNNMMQAMRPSGDRRQATGSVIHWSYRRP